MHISLIYIDERKKISCLTS